MSSVFKIYSPEDCDFYYDGELQGHIEGNSERAFRFEVERKGVYRMKFVNSEYKSELIEKVSIDADEEREVELDFREVNDPVIQERERERIRIAIECDYKSGRIPEEIISVISKNGIVTIPKGVRKIGYNAFNNCESLTSVTIPDSVTEIGHLAFYRCKNLVSVNIPDSVTEIGNRVFSKCKSLTSVTIPNGVTKIGERAFWFCRSLTSANIPDSVTEIGNCVFSCCTSLTSVTIPNSVTSIGNWAFDHCSLTSITIPDSVTEIGSFAFAFCNRLTSVYCKATTPPKFGCAIFLNDAPDLKIYVPKSDGSTVLEAYKSAERWKDYADIIEEYDFGNEYHIIQLQQQ